MKNPFFLTFTAMLFFASCQSVYFCDDFGPEGCRQKPSRVRIYEVHLPEEKLASWESLSYHLYFHARITPGLRVDHPFASSDLDRLRQASHCSYTLRQGGKEHRGHMEGLRLDETGLWCFDYLGSMLLDFHRQAGTALQAPDPRFSPFDLELAYETPLSSVRGMLSAQVSLQWEKAL
ncbi:MAG: hypothetical protein HS115_18110 [Spirochaetales bacterium]|nr:hypothetical protein [Spirochaetales bacterium]